MSVQLLFEDYSWINVMEIFSLILHCERFVQDSPGIALWRKN